MKKLLILFALCFLTLSGCKQNRSLSANSPEGLENKESGKNSNEDINHPKFRVEGVSLPEYSCSGTYYKLEVVPVTIDAESILQYLIPGFDESKVQKINNMELGEKCTIEVDGVTHSWSSEGGFSYFSDLPLGNRLTEEEALAKSDDFVKKNGLNVADFPLVREEPDGSYRIEYALQYEGIPIYGNDSIDLGTGGEEDVVHGVCIQVGVNGNGINRVLLSHFVECTGVMEKYQGENDFLAPNKLNALINVAFKNWEEERKSFGTTGDYYIEANKIDVIYIPFEEQGKQILLPAFRITLALELEGETYDSLMLIDAVTGRVYH